MCYEKVLTIGANSAKLIELNLDHFDLPYLRSILLDFQKLINLENMFSLLFMTYNMMGIGMLQIELKKKKLK